MEKTLFFSCRDRALPKPSRDRPIEHRASIAASGTGVKALPHCTGNFTGRHHAFFAERRAAGQRTAF